MKTTALLFTGVGRVELAETHVPEPGSGQVLIESLFSAISPGTELRCLSGRQAGGAFPFVPGYSLVGRITGCGPGVALKAGTVVFCTGTEKADRPLLWGAHIGHAVRGADHVYPLPEGVEPLEAAFTKLAAIAYRGVRAASTRPHDEVAVVGLGPIGQLAARLHALAGGRVVAADLDASRAAVARAAGVEAIVPDGDLVAAFLAVQPHGADIVVDSTGVPSVLQQSVRLGKAKPWDDALTEPTRLVVQGSYAENVIFDYHQAFYRELAVHFPRDNQPRDIHAILRLLARGRLKTRDLATRIANPREAQDVYQELRAAKPGTLTTVFQWT